MGLNTLKLPVPLGGVNDRGELDDIRPDECLWMRDVQPDDRNAAIRSRNGFIQQNISGAARVASIYGWRVVGTNFFLVQMTNGNLYPVSNAFALGSSIYSTGITNGSEVFAMLGYRNAAGNARLLIIPNSTSTPQQWDGSAAATTNWTNAPLNCSCMTLWRNRVIMGGIQSSARGHRVFYSNVGDPDAPASQYGNNWVDLIDAQTSAFDWIVGFGVAGDYLVVFKRMSTWVIYDPVTFNNRRISDIGAVDWTSIAQAQGRVFWIAAPDRMYSTNGVKVQEECPQAQFAPGEWQRGANSDQGRTWLAATEDELYCSQQTGNQGRELLYIPLRFKNSRGEWPVFKHFHRRTLNLDASTYTGNQQYMSVVAAVPRVDAYNPNLVGPRVRQFMFGGFSQAGSNPGRIYSVGNFGDGDQIQVTADTAESSVAAKFPAGWMVRFNGQEEEPLERLRRLNVLFRYGLTVVIAKEIDRKYVTTGFANNNDEPSFGADWTGSLAAVNGTVPYATYGRLRPEMRGRSLLLHFKKNIDAADDRVTVYELEVKYRGGKEH